MLRSYFRWFKDILQHQRINSCLIHYEQGQSPESSVREYFYYIDHQGQVGHSAVLHAAFILCVILL